MATGNRHKNLVKIGNAVFELCAHTDTKQTSEYFASLPGGGGLLHSRIFGIHVTHNRAHCVNM